MRVRFRGEGQVEGPIPQVAIWGKARHLFHRLLFGEDTGMVAAKTATMPQATVFAHPFNPSTFGDEGSRLKPQEFGSRDEGWVERLDMRLL